ncbi:hypothetical protein TIFTF001_015111 [Ficus carica]|uniref:Uncharacterized protein n=1 Tax=Ficus carica TaxID=3494 RepID=A0AA88AL00_FICCA|nr:hypothetical protein TIFTF001_015111 [Ficus carica]
MTLVDLVDLSSDDELGELDVRAVKLEAKVGSTTQQKEKSKIQLAKHQNSKIASTRQDHQENRSLNASSTGHSNSSILVQGQSPEDTGLSSTVSLSPAPLCRQFWKAGNYNDGLPSKGVFGRKERNSGVVDHLGDGNGEGGRGHFSLCLV